MEKCVEYQDGGENSSTTLVGERWMRGGRESDSG